MALSDWGTISTNLVGNGHIRKMTYLERFYDIIQVTALLITALEKRFIVAQ